MTKEEAIERIKKCLALASSDNEFESAAARRQANKLASMFNIDVAGLGENSIGLERVNCKTIKNSKLDHFEAVLLSVVGRYFDCDVLVWANDAGFIGAPCDVKMSVYVFSVLVKKALKRCDDQEEFCNLVLSREFDREQFLSGYALGCLQLLKKSFPMREDKKGKELDEFKKKLGAKTVSRNKLMRKFNGASHDGMLAASNDVIFNAFTESKNNQQRIGS